MGRVPPSNTLVFLAERHYQLLMSAEQSESSDEILVERTLAGDDSAYAALARRHRGKIAGMASRFAANSQDGEDLVQEIFIQAWRKLGQFKGGAPFEHWLSRIAVRKCYDLLRARQRGREDTVEPERWERMRELAQATDGPGTNGPEPADARELLNLAMARLGADEKLVITLLELEGRSVKEISAMSGWSESNVKVRAFRARNKLKGILEQLQ
jgi:RNA polymerase sigma-70 factor, ECF subfamily